MSDRPILRLSMIVAHFSLAAIMLSLPWGLTLVFLALVNFLMAVGHIVDPILHE